MKKIYLLILVAFISVSLNDLKAQTATMPAGQGTLSDPYKIETLNNLYWITALGTVNGLTQAQRWSRHYIQIANIDASATTGWFSSKGWLPIGTPSITFTGSYDGKGFAINALFINRPDRRTDIDYVGLFGYLGSAGILKNLGLTSVNITGKNDLAAVVGKNDGTISNCYSTGTIVGQNRTGGVVGHNTGTIEVSYSESGVNGRLNVGGLVGLNEGDVSFSYANIGGGKYITTSTQNSVLGGLVGQNNPSGSINSCYSTVDIFFLSDPVLGGGFVGYNSGDISNCYSFSSTVFDDGNPETVASGFVVDNYGSITNCYARGSVSAYYIAGFVDNNQGTVNDCFWDNSTLGIGIWDDGATECNEAEMQTQSTYTNWVFDCDVWGFNTGENDGCPFLIWQNDYGFQPLAADCNCWGGGTGSFSTAGNWTANQVPGASDDALIRNGNPQIGSDEEVDLLIIGGSNATLTINAGGSLTVNNLINKSGVDGLVLKSTSSGSGTLIHSTPNVEATVERYLAGTQETHLISTPVSGQNISDFLTEHHGIIAYNPNIGSGVYRMRHFVEAINTWSDYYSTSTSGNLQPGTAYSVGHVASNVTLTFKGTLTYPDKSVTLTKTGSGWNGIGNPFASDLNINAGGGFLDTYWTSLDPNYVCLYIWDPSTNTYTYINRVPGLSQNYVSSGQGFLVKANNGGDVTFSTSMRSHQNSTFYKSQADPSDWSNVVLKVQNASSNVLNTTLAFNQNMTSGIDVGYDAGLFTENEVYNLFSKVLEEENDLKLIVQALPSNWNEIMVVPLGLQYNNGGEVTFSVSSFTMPDDVTVWFEDREANIFTTITAESYSVTLLANSNPLGRFFLHIGKAVSSVELATSDDLTYCENETVNVLLTASADGVNYKWYRNDVLIPNATSKTYTATAAGSYKVVASVGGSSATSNAIVVVVNSLPEAAIATTNGLAYCEGENIDVLFNASPVGGTYRWFKNNELIPTATAATYTATAAGVYKSEVTVNGCSAESAAKEIVVNVLPEVTAPDDFSVCAGETVKLTATGNANTYTWSNSVINGEDFTPTQTATYTVTATITATGCQSTDNVTVTVNPLPVVTAPADIAICFNESVTLYALGNANTYAWDNSVVNGQSFTPTVTTTYTVTGTNTATGCEATDKVVVTVNPLPTITIPNDFAVCLGDEVTLTATGTADEYTWNNNVVNGEEFTPNQTSTYTVTARIAATGCLASDEITVDVNPLPTITATDDLSVCDGEEVTLLATGNADSYSWDNSVVNGQAFVPSNTSTYTVTATFTATGCENSKQVLVTVNPLPNFILATDTLVLSVQEQYLFDAGAGYSSYLWFNESTSQTYMFVASEWGEGVHEVWAEVANEFTCSTRDTAVVNVKTTTGVGTESPWSIILYPNPTSGDINLNVRGLNSQKVNITIVSALGQLVYQNEVQVSGGQIQEVINLRNNSSGVYMMIISDGANKLTRRIVIK